MSLIFLVLSIIVAIIYLFIKQFLVPIVVLFLFLIILFIIKLKEQKMKTGKTAFVDFQKREQIDQKKTLMDTMFSQIPDYHQQIITNTNVSDALLIMSSGVYLFKVSKARDVVNSSNKIGYWDNVRNQKHYLIPDDVYYLKKEAKELGKKLKVKVQPYLIISDFVSFTIPFDKNIIINREKNFIYKFTHHIFKKTYDEEQINQLYTIAYQFYTVK